MDQFMTLWHTAAKTSLGLFWMAFWAFGLGYVVSSMIQVFASRERMRRSMGSSDMKSVGLGALFGFLSSSCSFAALATTRSLFAKGAGLIPALAFLLSSTNLVIELGIVIAVFLGWQFVVGEYLGGVLLILLMWLAVRLTIARAPVEDARRRARAGEGGNGEAEEVPDWRQLIRSREGWSRVASRYIMEWHMVWKDVTIGFTVAGIIAAFVPTAFFQALFPGAGSEDPGFGELLLQTIAGPVAAFFTFIGSMGNIPLAAVLFDNGVAFAGIMAFIFSDLVVLPVLRIQARYYGWPMALYVLGVFLLILVATALILHYAFDLVGILPAAGAAVSVTERSFFKLDYTAVFNAVFLAVSAAFLIWHVRRHGLPGGHGGLSERVLYGLTLIAWAWLALGATLPLWKDVTG